MIGTDVQLASTILTSGGLVAIPTETVYGLAANAFNSNAVLSIFKAKNRPHFDPLIVHVHSYAQVAEISTSFPAPARALAKAYWPGPLTLILPKSDLISDLVTSGLPFVGIRMPRHSLTRKLLSKLSFPLAAPSANPFGYVSPTTAQHVEDQLGDVIDYVLDGGPCSVGLESTIVSFANEDKPAILRFGGVSEEDIRSVIGDVAVDIQSGSKPNSPGQLDSHYATRTLLKVVEANELSTLVKGENEVVIGFGNDVSAQFTYNLSPTGDLDEAAANLFRFLRLADDSSADKIIVSTVPDVGLGKAINDRLRRASQR